jgi:hypothetical protein
VRRSVNRARTFVRAIETPALDAIFGLVGGPTGRPFAEQGGRSVALRLVGSAGPCLLIRAPRFRGIHPHASDLKTNYPGLRETGPDQALVRPLWRTRARFSADLSGPADDLGPREPSPVGVGRRGRPPRARLRRVPRPRQTPRRRRGLPRSVDADLPLQTFRNRVRRSAQAVTTATGGPDSAGTVASRKGASPLDPLVWSCARFDGGHRRRTEVWSPDSGDDDSVDELGLFCQT